MLTLSVNFGNHILEDSTTLAVCWVVTRLDGTKFRGTSHDRNLVIATGDYAGTYLSAAAMMSSDIESKADGSVSNLEVEGAFQVDATIEDVTVDEIEGGVFDQAIAVLLEVNWQDPDDFQKVIKNGTLGEFYRDSEYRWRTEVRGPTQQLSQNFTQSYSERCNVKVFGDSRCKFDTTTIDRTGTVDSATSRKRFAATLDAGPAPNDDAFYGNGLVVWLTGDNAGFTREVRAHTPVGGAEDIEILLHDECPADIAAADTFQLIPGCDRLHGTCRWTFDNIVNFRGYGILAPGKAKMLRDPKTVIGEQAVTFESESEHDARRAATAALFQSLLP